MIRQVIDCETRNDPEGLGYFNAPRGDRKHTGHDFAVRPGAEILSPVDGTVGRIGYAYGDDLSYRIVDIRTSDGYRHRLFYVAPAVEWGDPVNTGMVIGIAQDVSRYYNSSVMIPHVHYEILNRNSKNIDPIDYRPTKTVGPSQKN